MHHKKAEHHMAKAAEHHKKAKEHMSMAVEHREDEKKGKKESERTYKGKGCKM